MTTQFFMDELNILSGTQISLRLGGAEKLDTNTDKPSLHKNSCVGFRRLVAKRKAKNGGSNIWWIIT